MSQPHPLVIMCHSCQGWANFKKTAFQGVSEYREARVKDLVDHTLQLKTLLGKSWKGGHCGRDASLTDVVKHGQDCGDMWGVFAALGQSFAGLRLRPDLRKKEESRSGQKVKRVGFELHIAGGLADVRRLTGTSRLQRSRTLVIDSWGFFSKLPRSVLLGCGHAFRRTKEKNLGCGAILTCVSLLTPSEK